MTGQKLLNTTLKINAGFSLLSGIDFILFDRTIGGIISANNPGSFVPMGLMLIGFAAYVFIVSMLSKVNKFLVGSIILMDLGWVIGSVVLVAVGYNFLTSIGLLLILLIAAVIGTFAYFQTRGLVEHLKTRTA